MPNNSLEAMLMQLLGVSSNSFDFMEFFKKNVSKEQYFTVSVIAPDVFNKVIGSGNPELIVDFIHDVWAKVPEEIRIQTTKNVQWCVDLNYEKDMNRTPVVEPEVSKASEQSKKSEEEASAHLHLDFPHLRFVGSSPKAEESSSDQLVTDEMSDQLFDFFMNMSPGMKEKAEKYPEFIKDIKKAINKKNSEEEFLAEMEAVHKKHGQPFFNPKGPLSFLYG